MLYNSQAMQKRLVGQAVKTSASHAENMGSIPVRVTNKMRTPKGCPFFLFLGDLVLGIEPSAHTDLSYNSRQSKHLSPTPLTTLRLCAMGSKHCSALSRGELVRRSKFPYKPPMGSTPSGFSFLRPIRVLITFTPSNSSISS